MGPMPVPQSKGGGFPVSQWPAREMGRGSQVHRPIEGDRKCRQQGLRQDENLISTYRCTLGTPWKAVESTGPGLRQQR